jgi:four helix bundle protein
VSRRTSLKDFASGNIPKCYVSKLADSDGEVAETQVWLDFARDCGYMPVQRRDELTKGYEEVGKMLGTMMSMPEKFLPRAQRRE